MREQKIDVVVKAYRFVVNGVVLQPIDFEKNGYERLGATCAEMEPNGMELTRIIVEKTIVPRSLSIRVVYV